MPLATTSAGSIPLLNMTFPSLRARPGIRRMPGLFRNSYFTLVARHLDCAGVDVRPAVRPWIAEEVGVRHDDRVDSAGTDLFFATTLGFGTCNVVDSRRGPQQRVVTEHDVGRPGARDRVQQRERAPTDVDPVVALVHGRGRCQAED